jgi:carbon storage regulator
MLILSRRKGESLKLGDDVEITVLRTAGGQVSLGITAPRTLSVLRGELAAAVLAQNQAAALGAPSDAELGALSGTFRPAPG